MGMGHLKVQVHTGDDALPLENANVLIKDTYGKVLYNLTTDKNGNTESVDLYAPNKNQTMTPFAPGPYYSTYDVEIRRPLKFITQIMKGVQIFTGIDSILPVNLLPNPTPTEEVENINYIPPNDLHSSMRRHQENQNIEGREY